MNNLSPNTINLNNTLTNTADLMQEIYDSDLLLNQYILQSNGSFLYQLESFINIDKKRLLSLGNPLVFQYLVNKKELGIFFDDFCVGTQPIGFLKDSTTPSVAATLLLLFQTNNPSLRSTIAPAFSLFQKIFVLQSTFLNEDHYPYKNNVGETINNHLNPVKPIRFFSSDDYQSLFTFLLNYPQFKNLFYSSPIDDKLSFDEAIFIEKRHIIEEFEKTSFFCVTELLFHKFYEDNSHIDSLPHLKEHIISFANEFHSELSKFNSTANIPLSLKEYSLLHPNSQRSLNSKKLSFEEMETRKNNDFSLLSKWKENPTSSFLHLQKYAEGKIPLYSPFDDKNSIKHIHDWFDFLYASPSYILSQLIKDNNSDFIEDSVESYFVDYPDILIQSIIDNNIFFLNLSSPYISEKPLAVSKKIWTIFSENINNPKQILLNYLITQSYAQENPVKIQMALELTDFEMQFINNSVAAFNSPFSLFNNSYLGLNFYIFYSNITWTDKDIELIKHNKLIFTKNIPIMEEIHFEQKVFDVIQNNLLDKIINIKPHDNLSKHTSFYLNLFPKSVWNLFNERVFNIRDKNSFHYRIEDFLNKFNDLLNSKNNPYANDSPLHNQSFRRYIMQSCVLTSIANESIALNFDHLILDFHLPLRNQFDASELNYHQNILNRKFLSTLDNYQSFPITNLGSCSLSLIEDYFKFFVTKIENNTNKLDITINNLENLSLLSLAQRFDFSLFHATYNFYKYSKIDFSSFNESLHLLGNITLSSENDFFNAFNILGASSHFFSVTEKTLEEEYNNLLKLERNILLLSQLNHKNIIKNDSDHVKKKI